MSRKERIQRMREQDLSYEAIGYIEGISRQRVCQILNPRPSLKRPEPVLLAIGAAARYLGIHPNTLRRWTAARSIKCVRLPSTRRDRRYSKVELDNFLKRAADTVKGGDP